MDNEHLKLGALEKRLRDVALDAAEIANCLGALKVTPAPDPPRIGEPWVRSEDGFDGLDAAGGFVFTADSEVLADHIIACANALAGIANPAAVPKLLKHLREVMDTAAAKKENATLFLCGTVAHLLAALDKAPGMKGDG